MAKSNAIDAALSNTSKVLDAWLPFKTKFDEVPSYSVGIVYKGKLVYKKGFGFADLESKVPATPETGYHIASISKIFTSIAILQLVEQKKLALDDPVEKHLSWFKSKNKKLQSKHITIRQLLSHTAGVFRDGTTAHWVDDQFPTEKQLRESIGDSTLVVENLTQFKYSNFGYALLGQVIESVSGMSYSNYIKKNIFQKLGMDQTIVDYNENFKGPLATGYSRLLPGDEMVETFIHAPTNAYAPAAGFISNVVDLAKFLPLLSKNYSKKNNILDREMKKEMQKEYWKTATDKDFYGLGLDIYEIEKRKIIGHSGGFSGFITKIGFDEKNDFGVIVLSNRLESNNGFIHNAIFELIYYFMDQSKKFGKVDSSLKKYEGYYRNRWGRDLVIAIGDHLVSIPPGQNSPVAGKSVLSKQSKDTFIIEDEGVFGNPKETVRFIFDADKTTMLWGPTPTQKISNLI